MKQLKKGFPESLSVVEYAVTSANGIEFQKVAMFNETVVSETEVRNWIKQGLLGFEYKPTVVIMSKQQYENLFDHVSVETENSISEEFYDELRMEQRGGIY